MYTALYCIDVVKRSREEGQILDWIDCVKQWLISLWPVSLASFVGVLLADALKSGIKVAFDYESKKKLQKQQFDLNKSLEKIKTSLQEGVNRQEQIFQSMSNFVKFDLNRREKDFSLYSSKRHETYLLLHQAILEAKSAVMSQRGYIDFPDFNRYSFSEIKSWLDKHHFADIEKNIVLNLWEKDKKEAVKKANELEILLRYYDADRAVIKAKNTMLDYQLYLSEEIFLCSDQLISDIGKLNINYRPSDLDFDHVKLHKESEEIKIRINDEFKDITEKMKAELQTGYYEDMK